ncbi:MAG: hypothetical protein HON68_07595 [Gammaproteobacteria bacterium]|jgi:hypothetical protein|nr:hypothetical protein [Gammaproteobacteria bacterium]MBT3490579.1 hypothetical protein [Gammaproteobacteria bacterium]MBT3718369.1 hypothetical protein [Gammaproteobacteria bacterium]MBT3845177.1 hypothetical protein [Gammaproteobacteria bacterium]MBT3892686.1 hypothetical protein [Gammaproteobacteria bacterium]
MNHLLAILALVALLFGWVLFQEWLKRRDPEQFGYKPGCGACGSKGSCSTSTERQQVTLKIGKL